MATSETMQGQPYQPRRDHRFDHAGDAIEHVEQTSCRLGCKRAGAEGVVSDYPSGTCEIPLGVLNEVDEIPEWDDRGGLVVCLVREPLTTKGCQT